VLNVFYTAEMGIRIIALGPPWVLSYLRSPWNAFDAFMVVTGYTVFIPTTGDDGSAGAVRALRALRALRPLRTITRFQALRSIVVCFIEVRMCSLARALCTSALIASPSRRDTTTLGACACHINRRRCPYWAL
jgi:hypothetical protein